MENKSDTKVVLLIVFIIISFLLAGFVVYDKFIKKETCNCPKTDCQCEKCTNNDGSNKENKLALSSKYINEADEKSYISFDVTNGKWTGTRNGCHDYEDVGGTFLIEDGKVVLTYDKEIYAEETIVELKITADSLNSISKLYDLSADLPITTPSYHFAGCSGSDYYIAEK